MAKDESAGTPLVLTRTPRRVSHRAIVGIFARPKATSWVGGRAGQRSARARVRATQPTTTSRLAITFLNFLNTETFGYAVQPLWETRQNVQKGREFAMGEIVVSGKADSCWSPLQVEASTFRGSYQVCLSIGMRGK